MTAVKAFFYTAQDARRALNALQAAGAEVSDPQPLQPGQAPENGRQWVLEIEMAPGSSTTRHPNPVLADRVFEIVLKNNGITNQVG